MGLNVYIKSDEPVKVTGTGIYVRRNGKNEQLSYAEAVEMYGKDNVSLRTWVKDEYYSDHITHNLTGMARFVGLYKALWKPYLLKHPGFDEELVTYEEADELEENTTVLAKDLIEPLAAGIKKLLEQELEAKMLNPKNGWGSYESLLSFTKNYLTACMEHPDAEIEVWR